MNNKLVVGTLVVIAGGVVVKVLQNIKERKQKEEVVKVELEDEL